MSWRTSDNYFHREQLWRASDEAIVAAAAEDKSQQGQRNTLNPRYLPALSEFPDL